MAPATKRRRRDLRCIIPLSAGVNTFSEHHTQKRRQLSGIKVFLDFMEKSIGNLEEKSRSIKMLDARPLDAPV
jgi:hypothetical protein